MKTLADVKAEYDVDSHGMIRSLGKFESESWYAPIVYEWMLHGLAEPIGENIDMFELDDTDRDMFELDAGHVAMILEVSDQGFVSVSPVYADELERLLAAIEEESQWI